MYRIGRVRLARTVPAEARTDAAGVLGLRVSRPLPVALHDGTDESPWTSTRRFPKKSWYFFEGEPESDDNVKEKS